MSQFTTANSKGTTNRAISSARSGTRSARASSPTARKFASGYRDLPSDHRMALQTPGAQGSLFLRGQEEQIPLLFLLSLCARVASNPLGVTTDGTDNAGDSDKLRHPALGHQALSFVMRSGETTASASPSMVTSPNASGKMDAQSMSLLKSKSRGTSTQRTNVRNP